MPRIVPIVPNPDSRANYPARPAAPNQADLRARLHMAEHLLDEGYKDPAAVLIDCVLEDTLGKVTAARAVRSFARTRSPSPSRGSSRANRTLRRSPRGAPPSTQLLAIELIANGIERALDRVQLRNFACGQCFRISSLW
jgi:hypothetical protein